MPCPAGVFNVVLNGTDDKEDTAEAHGGSADKVASGFGGLTIVLAPDDMSWVGIMGVCLVFPSRLPQSAPPRGRTTPRATLLSSLSIAFLVLTEPLSMHAFTPTVGRAGLGRGGGHVVAVVGLTRAARHTW